LQDLGSEALRELDAPIEAEAQAREAPMMEPAQVAVGSRDGGPATAVLHDAQRTRH